MELPEDVLEHYAQGWEDARLARGAGRLEALRTLELLEVWLPPAPAVVLDIGGGTGPYAEQLAARGYEVHLVDPVPLHVEQARARTGLASVRLGDARALPFEPGGADAVLLLGPLYHLTAREDRLLALSEAARVLRPGGVVVAAAISRWASTADGLVRGLLRDARFGPVVERDVVTGVHLNEEREPGWFATAYVHRPEELAEEVAAAGLAADGPVAVEGLAWFSPDLDGLLDDADVRERVLEAVRRVEREPALLGASAHLLVAGRRPEGGEDVVRLREHVERVLPTPWPAYRGGYDEVEAALLDAVLSIRSRYGATPATGVRGAVGRWREHRGGARLDDLGVLAATDPEVLAGVLRNRQVLSGGATKAQAVVSAAGRLVAAGVTRAADLEGARPEHRQAYVGVRGLGPVTWTYLVMLLGGQGVKADTWVVRFVEQALGRSSSPRESEDLVTAVALDMGVEAKALDHAIWRWMSEGQGA